MKEITFYAELVARVVPVYGEVPPSTGVELLDTKNETFRYAVDGREINATDAHGNIKARRLKVLENELPHILVEIQCHGRAAGELKHS